MSKVRVFVETRGGVIQTVCASKNIKIVIIDYDNIDNGASPVSEVLAPDAIFLPGEAHELFTEPGLAESEVKEAMKRLKF
jgi:hypothetical protein